MLTYIRTKDGIFIGDKNDVGAWLINAPYKIFDRDILKVADAIEKLCDEFVVIVDGKHYIRVPGGNPNFQTYGAIWTDKGLIYVAKMNDKGELELL